MTLIMMSPKTENNSSAGAKPAELKVKDAPQKLEKSALDDKDAASALASLNRSAASSHEGSLSGSDSPSNEQKDNGASGMKDLKATPASGSQKGNWKCPFEDCGKVFCHQSSRSRHVRRAHPLARRSKKREHALSQEDLKSDQTKSDSEGNSMLARMSFGATPFVGQWPGASAMPFFAPQMVLPDQMMPFMMPGMQPFTGADRMQQMNQFNMFYSQIPQSMWTGNTSTSMLGSQDTMNAADPMSQFRSMASQQQNQLMRPPPK